MTAETAMVLPLLVAMALALAWLVALAGTQVRLVDAAREVARAVARDDDRAQAVALGRRVAPDGARISVRQGSHEVAVRVTVAQHGPGGLLRFLPPARLSAESVAAREQR